MNETNVNAKRFIVAYNRLDQGLRDIYSIKRNQSRINKIL